MMILYDIDMTLLETDHIGIDLLRKAGNEHIKQGFTIEGVTFGGCLDQDIIIRMIQNNGVEPTLERIAAMRKGYHAGLEAHSPTQGWSNPLPGAHELVNATRAMAHQPTIGLLTGNYPETGKLKLLGAGFNPDHFEICVWGDDSPHHPPARSHLPPVALERAQSKGIEIAHPSKVLIIGDTVHDVSCALDNGMSVLGVATGHHSREELEAAGAHHVVDDLTDTQGITAWINDTLRRQMGTAAP